MSSLVISNGISDIEIYKKDDYVHMVEYNSLSKKIIEEIHIQEDNIDDVIDILIKMKNN